jgi:ATP-dependent Lhr-like helicase
MSGERELFVDSAAASEEGPDDSLDAIFPHRFGSFSFTDLLRSTRMDSSTLVDLLWERAWRGELSTDTFAPVRQAVTGGFQVESTSGLAGHPSRRRRPRFDRWQSDRPVTGTWHRLQPVRGAGDALEAEEDRRERARVLLDRYGVVFRELINRELSGLRWSEVFRPLRMLELAGEVVAGRFFEGVPGIQFMSQTGFRRLQEGLPEDLVWWVNAVDPASPCGLGLEGLSDLLPRRIQGNHVVFHGRRPVVVSQRRGEQLSIRVAPDHPSLTGYLQFLKHLLTRSVQPLKAITIEQINDSAAATSDYRPVFEQIFHVTRTPTALRLSRRY